jgi:hypothetical protein
MSTVKISELAAISQLNSDTANTIFVGVDIPSGVTGKITATTIASGLYSRNKLNVGTTPISLPNTVGQFADTSSQYIQVNLVNTNNSGTADYVVGANTGTDTTSYLDMGFTNSLYSNTSPYNSLGTAIEPLSGYLYAQGTTAGASGGNLILGTTTPGTETRFLAGGINSQNIAMRITSSGPRINTGYSLIFGDATIQTTAAASLGYSTSGYNQANSVTLATQSAYNQANSVTLATQSAYNQANSVTLSTLSAYNQANSANVLAQAAFNKANNALANTTGTFAGSLAITGSLSAVGSLLSNGTVLFANSSFSPSEAAVRISASSVVQTPINDGYMLHITGKQSIPTRVIFDTFSATGNAYSVIAGRTARGTAAIPLASQSNDVLMRISGNAYGSTGYAATGVARIDIVAAQNHTDSARGSRIEFWNMANNTNTFTNIATFNGDTATFTGVVSPQKGFIWTPLIYPGAQTTIALDFANNSVIKANVSSDANVSFTNYTTGKIVDVWITNTSGLTRTITHGCSALNSTVNSTTFTMSATSSAYLKYFSISNDLANTFVSVTRT